jgi:GcrA cell cycle regulator
MLDRPIHRDQSEWTEARTEELTRRWLAGESAAQIAAAMGGLSRSAVIGKVHRMHMARGSNPKLARQKAPRTVKGEAGTLKAYVAVGKVHGNKDRPRQDAVHHRAEAATIKPPRIMPEPTGLPEVSARRRLIDLRANDCRWCDGDPLTADHSFCGMPVKDGSSWCHAHHAIVFLRS